MACRHRENVFIAGTVHGAKTIIEVDADDISVKDEYE